jgi:hypothetical protein
MLLLYCKICSEYKKLSPGEHMNQVFPTMV